MLKYVPPKKSSMPDLEPHENWLYKEQQSGYVALAVSNSYLEILLSNGDVKVAFSKGGKTHYKLTRSGWEIIKKAKKIFG